MVNKAQPEAERTRFRILQTAAAFFGTESFENVSIERIATSAGVSSDEVQLQFCDKSTLFTAVFDHLEQTLYERTGDAYREASEDPVEAILAAFEVVITAASDPITHRVLFVETPLRLRKELNSMHWMTHLVRHLSRIYPEASDQDLAPLAVAVQGFANHAALHLRSPGASTVEEYLVVLEQLLRHGLD